MIVSIIFLNVSFLSLPIWLWTIVIFLIVVLIYIVIYLDQAKKVGKSVVITTLIKKLQSEQNINDQGLQEEDTDIVEATAEKELALAEKEFETAKQAQISLESALSIAVKALETAGKALRLSLKAFSKAKIQQKQILSTEFVQPTIADQYYYLPTASLVIKANATVVITKSNYDDGSSSTTADLTQLQLENTVVIEADTKQLFSLNYNSFSFANDELRLTTNASGLLESISVTTEDRISNIISEISAAPKNILAAPSASFRAQEFDGQDQKQLINVATQTVVYTNTFFILSEEVEDGSFKREWKINVDVTNDKKITKNASFTCNLNTIKSVASIPLNENIDGILTRPMQKVRLDVQLTDNTISPEVPLKYQILIPDHSVLINVPIKRARFVKKIHTPKFSNGLLIENYINKPSEVEGALSIPINILKAIVSIPAQLLSFKIAHLQQETALETAKHNLNQAKFLSKKDESAKETQLLKARLETEKTAVDSQKEILNANKDFVKARTNWDNTKNELNSLLKDVNEAQQINKDQNVPEEIIIQAIEENESVWKGKYNVIEISLGKKKTNGLQTNISCVVFKPIEKLDANSVNLVSIPQIISYTANDGVIYKIRTDVLETKGLIVASLKVDKNESCDGSKPAKPGCSVSRVSSNATGTIGLKAFKEGNAYIVGCYHVLCSPELEQGFLEFEVLKPKGDTTIISPSLQDHGIGTDVIAKVAEGSLTSFLDCAIAILNNDEVVAKEICRFNQAATKVLVISPAHADARYTVYMSGRTSIYRSAKITNSYSSPDITYRMNDRNLTKTINGLICTTLMSDGGDSGAPVVDEDCNLIGIIVATSPTNTYIIPISRILTYFKLTLNK